MSWDKKRHGSKKVPILSINMSAKTVIFGDQLPFFDSSVLAGFELQKHH
jgi:hypothetical protein